MSEENSLNFERQDPKLLTSTNVKTGPALQIADEEDGRASKEGQSIDLSNESINELRKPERESTKKKALTVKFANEPDAASEEEKRRTMSPKAARNDGNALSPKAGANDSEESVRLPQPSEK